MTTWNASVLAALHAAAAAVGLEPALVRAVAWIESRGNPAAVSPAGAQGLMQLMPATAAGLGVTDPFDPFQNAAGGARYLEQLIRQFGDTTVALWAYNWGPGNVARAQGSGKTIPAEVITYARNVLARAAVERAADPLVSAPAKLSASQASVVSHCLCPACGSRLAVAADPLPPTGKV
jgi:soluble lytic murein transglycosylase-like protein